MPMAEKAFHHVGLKKKGGMFVTHAAHSPREIIVRRRQQVEQFNVGKIKTRKHKGKVAKGYMDAKAKLPVKLDSMKVIASSYPQEEGGTSFYATPSGRTAFYGPVSMKLKVNRKLQEFSGLEIKGAGRSGKGADDKKWRGNETGIIHRLHHRGQERAVDTLIRDKDIYDIPEYVDDFDYFPPTNIRRSFQGFEGSMPLIDAKREFDNLKRAEEHGVIVPKPIAVFEVPLEELPYHVKQEIKETKKNKGKVKYIVGSTKGRGEVYVEFDTKKLTPGQVIRAVRSPIRLATIVGKKERRKYAKAKGMTLTEYNAFLFKRMGANLRRLADAGLVHDSLHEDNITAEGEFTDGLDMHDFEKYYKENTKELNEMHKNYPRLKAKEKNLPSREDILIHTYIPFFQGLHHIITYGKATEGRTEGIVATHFAFEKNALKSKEMLSFLEGLTGSKKGAREAINGVKGGSTHTLKETKKAFREFNFHPFLKKLGEGLLKHYEKWV